MGMYQGYAPGEDSILKQAARQWRSNDNYKNSIEDNLNAEALKRKKQQADALAALLKANPKGKTMEQIDAKGKTFTSDVDPWSSSVWGKINGLENNLTNSVFYKNVANSPLGKFLSTASDSASSVMGAHTGDARFKPTTTGNKVADIAANLIGSGIGFVANPTGTVAGSVNKMFSPLGFQAERGGMKTASTLSKLSNNNNVVNKAVSYLPTIAENGAMMGTQSAGLTAANGGNVKDVLKSGLEGAGAGALFGAGVKGAGELLSKIPSKTNLQPLTSKLEPKGATTSQANKLNLQAFAESNSTPDNGAVNILRPMELTTGGERKTSKFYSNSIQNTKVLNDAEKDMLNEAEYQYNVKSNAADLERAKRNIETKGLKGVVDEHLQNNGDKLTSTQVMENFIITKGLAAKARETGLDSDYRNLMNWTKINRGQYTEAGQAIQAISVYKKATPEGMLLEAEKQIGGAAKTVKKKNPKKAKKAESEVKEAEDQLKAEGKGDTEIEAALDKIYKKNGIPNLTTEDTKFILDTMTNAQNLEGRAKDIEIAKVTQLIADKLPSSMPEKVRGWQRISMLLNPKTMVRNILGNVVMGGLENIKDIPATVLDSALSKKSGIKTTGLPSVSTQAKAMLEGAKQVREDSKLGIDTSPSRGQYDLPQGRTFGNPVLNKLDKMTKHGLQYGDVPFYKSAYEDKLRILRKKNKNNDKISDEDMINLAKDEAENKTFQNASAIAKGFDELRKALNHISGVDNFGFGNLVMPFTKTPANILDKAIDYSPAAAIKLAKQCVDIRKEGLNAFNQKKFVDTFGRGVTGTAIIALGYRLAESGLMNGATNKDADKAAMDKLSGDLPYSFKIDGTSYTFDWAQPSSVPLAIGADVYESGKGKEGLWNTIVSAVQSGGTTLFNQSLFQSLQKLMGGYDPVGGLTKTAQAWPSQFIPTVFKQVAQAIDDTTRSTYDTSGGKASLNSLESKIPFATKNLEPKVNVLGEDTKTYDSEGLARLGDIFLNPGFHSSQLNNKGVELVKKIYDETGEIKQFPKVADKSFIVDGDKITLTAKEYTEYQKMLGQRTNDYLNSLSDTGEYSKMADDIQSKMTDINKEAKAKILEDRGILYPSFLKDQITEQIKYNTSDKATSVRKTVDQIVTSNRTNGEKAELLQTLQGSITGMKQGKAPKKKNTNTLNPFNK